jgi:hypothetical protein
MSSGVLESAAGGVFEESALKSHAGVGVIRGVVNRGNVDRILAG